MADLKRVTHVRRAWPCHASFRRVGMDNVVGRFGRKVPVPAWQLASRFVLTGARCHSRLLARSAHPQSMPSLVSCPWR